MTDLSMPSSSVRLGAAVPVPAPDADENATGDVAVAKTPTKKRPLHKQLTFTLFMTGGMVTLMSLYNTALHTWFNFTLFDWLSGMLLHWPIAFAVSPYDWRCHCEARADAACSENSVSFWMDRLAYHSVLQGQRNGSLHDVLRFSPVCWHLARPAAAVGFYVRDNSPGRSCCKRDACRSSGKEDVPFGVWREVLMLRGCSRARQRGAARRWANLARKGGFSIFVHFRAL